MAKDLSVYVNIKGKLEGSLAAAISGAKGRLDGLTRHFKAQAAAQRSAISGVAESFRGMAGLAAAGGVVFSLKHAFKDGGELAHEIQALRNAGRDAHEVAEGIEKANAAIRDIPTATLAGSMKILNETTGAFGDYHHALDNLDFNSKLAAVLQNTTGPENPEHDIGSLIKALEIRGSAANPEKYRAEAGELQRAMTFYGGRLKADDIYTFASNAQQGIRQLSPRFLTKIAPALIQEMGGDKTGTGLTAFRTIISGRKITDKKQAKAWQDLGLLNKKDIIHNKMGDVTGWKDGAIKGTKLAYEDPMEFMETVILKRLKDRGTDIADPIKLGAALNTLFKNTKAAAFVTAISTVVDRARLHKDEKLIEKVLDLDKNYDGSLDKDPKLALRALKASLTDLGAAMTVNLQIPMAQGMVRLARGIQALSASLMEHPERARLIAQLAGAFVLWQAIRFANIIFGVGAMVTALANLTIAATTGLAARLLGIARGIVAITAAGAIGAARGVLALGRALLVLAAFPFGLAGRLRGIALAVMMLGAGGTARAVLGGLAGALVVAGAAVLRFPVMALRGIGLAMWALVANPVGIVVGALVTALAGLGLWVKNNWAGIKSFFLAFGTSFMEGLGPGPASAVNTLVGSLKSVWDWVNRLLGSLDTTGVKWVEWGAAAGRGAAAVVNAIAELPKLVADAAVATGKAIVSGIVAGITGAGSAIAGAVTGALGSVKSVFGIGSAAAAPAAPAGGAPAAPKAGGMVGMRAALAGKRAMGGPVSAGLPYLVGERGPEIFVPDTYGLIKTNADRHGPAVDMTAVAKARASAAQTGAVMHRELDATRSPRIETASIDVATKKASKLQSILAAIGNSSIDVGGGLGGAMGGGGAGGGLGGGGPRAGGRQGFMGRGGGGATVRDATNYTGSNVEVLKQAAATLGTSPQDLATVISYETQGTFSPGIWGGKRGGYMGLIQFGGPERKQFGANDKQTFAQQMPAVVSFLKTRGYKPGMGILDLYSTINAGRPGMYGASDGNGTVRSHTARMIGEHAGNVAKFLGSKAAPAGASKEPFKPTAGPIDFRGLAKNADGSLKKIDVAPATLAGARAMGGPVGSGLSYLVGERGPEIFTPGADGGISTNGVFKMLKDGSVAPSPEKVAANAPSSSVTHNHGDRHFSNTWNIEGANDPMRVQAQVETIFGELLRRAESDQRGLLSD